MNPFKGLRTLGTVPFVVGIVPLALLGVLGFFKSPIFMAAAASVMAGLLLGVLCEMFGPASPQQAEADTAHEARVSRYGNLARRTTYGASLVGGAFALWIHLKAGVTSGFGIAMAVFAQAPLVMLCLLSRNYKPLWAFALPAVAGACWYGYGLVVANASRDGLVAAAVFGPGVLVALVIPASAAVGLLVDWLVSRQMSRTLRNPLKSNPHLEEPSP